MLFRYLRLLCGKFYERVLAQVEEKLGKPDAEETYTDLAQLSVERLQECKVGFQALKAMPAFGKSCVRRISRRSMD